MMTHERYYNRRRRRRERRKRGAQFTPNGPSGPKISQKFMPWYLLQKVRKEINII